MKATDEKAEREPKLNLRASWTEICRKQKGLMWAMIGLAVVSLILLIFALITMHPQSSVVIVGYGDVYGEITGLSGGYRRDSWMNMLAFPILAVIFGVVHNVIALRVYRKYGKNLALMVVAGTGLIIVGVIVAMLRILGEW